MELQNSDKPEVDECHDEVRDTFGGYGTSLNNDNNAATQCCYSMVLFSILFRPLPIFLILSRPSFITPFNEMITNKFRS